MCRDVGPLAIPSLKTLSRTSEKRLINVTDTYFPGELERECENYLIREMSPEKSVEEKTKLDFKKVERFHWSRRLMNTHERASQ